MQVRLNEERKLLDKLPLLDSIQVAWLLLYYCAAPRANHLMRTVPPQAIEFYVREHDRAVRMCLANILRIDSEDLELAQYRMQLELPHRFAGLGLRNNERIAPCAYWASWVDCLKIINDRQPGVIHLVHERMQALEISSLSNTILDNTRRVDAVCLAANLLVQEGLVNIPSWNELLQGIQAPSAFSDETDHQYGRGWQRIASEIRENVTFERLLQTTSEDNQARIRSCSGEHTSSWLTALPTEQALILDDCIFRCAVQRRLGLPVMINRENCEGCHRELDAFGFHRTCCMQTGRNHARHKIILKSWIRILREGGIHIREHGTNKDVERMIKNTFLRCRDDDNRRMDIVTSGYDGIMGGLPIIIDVTCVSPVTGYGTGRRQASTLDGSALLEADRRNKETDYPDVERCRNATLICAGVETYGRWSLQCIELVRQLARYRTRDTIEVLRNSARSAYAHRWWRLLSCCVQRVVCENILYPAAAYLAAAAAECNHDFPLLHDVLDAYRV